MADPRSVPPPITLTPAVETIHYEDPHKHMRRFIGPMPEKVITASAHMTKEQHRTWFSPSSQREPEDREDAALQNAIREHALRFFLGRGGQEEHWGEEEERCIRQEMYARWKQSEWGQARARRREDKSGKRWVGGSFDVGVFLGVNLLDVDYAAKKDSILSSMAGESTSRLGGRTGAGVSTLADTFVTAQTGLARPENGTSYSAPNGLEFRFTATQDSDYLTHGNGELQRPISMDSSTPLLSVDNRSLLNARWNPRARSEIVRQSISTDIQPHSSGQVPNGTQDSVSTPGSSNRGKQKMVHYEELPTPGEYPAPPEEVLTRAGSEINETSAGASQEATAENQVPRGEVIMRDRMLVRVSYSEAEVIPPDFDEGRNRVTQQLKNDNWAEYIVAWRKERLELYRDHTTPGKEWWTGHKHLAYIVSLSATTTRLSLYSFNDLSFCIVCPPATVRTRTRRRVLLGRRRGLNLFVFKAKTRSRAVDWIWQLWLHLGGQLPPTLEIRCPTLDTRIRIDVPSSLTSAYRTFTAPNAIALCKEKLRETSDYENLIQRELERGTGLALAWRMGTRLDWVWHIRDAEEKERKWAVLCGLALRQGKQPAHLELRLQEHRPTRINLHDGTRLDEPAGIEGYLERIRSNSQLKQPTYLSTHDGYLFFLPPARCEPPPPPGPPPSYSALSEPSSGSLSKDMRNVEVERGAKQIMQANGVLDLRSIVIVRRAFHVVALDIDEGILLQARSAPEWEDTDGFWDAVNAEEEDMRDVGGEDELNKLVAGEKPGMRMRRSFELVLKTGKVLRFETHSCQVALEWISHLRPLISYWRKRHQVDARHEMDLLYVSTGRPRITPQKHIHAEEDALPELVPDPAETSVPDLSVFYNWCVMEGCRPIGKCGRLFGRRGLRGQYKHLQLLMVSGHLVEFHITPTPTTTHHKRKTLVSLRDAYVTSGYFAVAHLPSGQYNPDAEPLAKRWQDGLEAEDGEEDTVFMIWWYKTKGDDKPSKPQETSEDKPGVTAAIPPLNAKRKLSVYRTRSKLERDAWVWAINCEIERVVRAAPEREVKEREAGGLITARCRNL